MPFVHPAIPQGGDGSNSAPLQVDNSGNLLVNVAEGSFAVSSGAQYNATPPTFTNGETGPLQCDVNGKLLVAGTINASSSATYNSSTQNLTSGSSNALQSDSHGALLVSQRDSSGAVQGALGNPLRVDPTGTTTQPVSIAASVAVTGTFWQATQPVSLASVPTHAVTQSGSWSTSTIPATSGGLSASKLVSAASTNATSVKTSAGQLYNVQAFNTNASARFLKIYNKASAPTVGTDTPVATFLVPGNASGAGCVIEISNGLALSAGLAFAITGGMADSDTTAIGAGDCVVNLQYK